jgi:hypothetical protein
MKVITNKIYFKVLDNTVTISFIPLQKKTD